MVGSSFINTLLNVLCFFPFPFVNSSRGNEPCTSVFQIVALTGFCFFFFHKLIQIVFPSRGRSSGFPFEFSLK